MAINFSTEFIGVHEAMRLRITVYYSYIVLPKLIFELMQMLNIIIYIYYACMSVCHSACQCVRVYMCILYIYMRTQCASHVYQKQQQKNMTPIWPSKLTASYFSHIYLILSFKPFEYRAFRPKWYYMRYMRS